eukprot:scaffold65_cov353-Prasinococcus_capsulatus_cf.AAC.5
MDNALADGGRGTAAQAHSAPHAPGVWHGACEELDLLRWRLSLDGALRGWPCRSARGVVDGRGPCLPPGHNHSWDAIPQRPSRRATRGRA